MARAPVQFDDGDLIDGEVSGWPASFIATNYGPQGWALHLAPYTKMDGDEERPTPPEILRILDRANDKASGMRKPSKADIRKILQEIDFTPDTQ